jgi:serine palmitoyltransferase
VLTPVKISVIAARYNSMPPLLQHHARAARAARLLAGAVLLVALPSRLLASSGAARELLSTPLSQLFTWDGLSHAAAQFWAVVGPGGELHPTYFLEHKGHLVVEGVLLAVIAYLFLQTAFQPSKPSEEQLTDKVCTWWCKLKWRTGLFYGMRPFEHAHACAAQEVDQLCRDWKPEPLTADLPAAEELKPRIVTRCVGLCRVHQCQSTRHTS